MFGCCPTKKGNSRVKTVVLYVFDNGKELILSLKSVTFGLLGSFSTVLCFLLNFFIFKD